MKKIIFYTIILLFINCSQKQGLKDNFVLKDNISQIVDSFVIENPNLEVYELFINKIDPHNAILILYGGSSSLTTEENEYQSQEPLLSIPISGENIYIYSGAERYIENTNSNINNAGNNINNSEKTIYWVVKDSFNILTITKYHGTTIYPYMPIMRTINPNILNIPVIEE